MKTFDLAMQYIKHIEGLKDFNLFESSPVAGDITEAMHPNAKQMQQRITQQMLQYCSDGENNVSNDYYRSIVFAAAIYHSIQKAKNEPSYFDVCCDIIKKHAVILHQENYIRYKDMVYPQEMIAEFFAYCKNQNPQPCFLNDESEVRFEFFTTAYHYLLDNVA